MDGHIRQTRRRVLYDTRNNVFKTHVSCVVNITVCCYLFGQERDWSLMRGPGESPCPWAYQL